jgi:quinoprotein glucose dehydrogenase
LREGLGRDPSTQSVQLTTPGVVYKDLLIVGGRVSEGLPASPGDVRAYDVRGGALRGRFIRFRGRIIRSRDLAEDAWTYTGGVNNWGDGVDEARGIVYVLTGSASADFYGANRPATTSCELLPRSRRRPPPPLAFSGRPSRHLGSRFSVAAEPGHRDAQRAAVDAVSQTAAGSGLPFDRSSGTPLFPIESSRYPESTVAGERAAATQPLPIRPKPFARQRLTEQMLTTRTPDVHRAALDAFRRFRSDGQFVPLSVGSQTVIFPGFDGGAEWGGSAFDPESGLLYVNANEMAWTASLAPNDSSDGGARQTYLASCASCHRDDMTGTPPQIPSLVDVGRRRTADDLSTIVREGAGRMPGFPALSPAALAALVTFLRTGQSDRAGHDASATRMKYRFTGYRKFLDAEGYPAIAPPWGTLSAINLGTGEYAWQIPLGEYPELAAQGMRNTGSENYGGPIVTAGGLVFIAATNFDKKFRAFDKATGDILWEASLPLAGNATPSTYAVEGRQFVVVPAGGGRSRPGAAPESGGVYVAYALPAR